MLFCTNAYISMFVDAIMSILKKCMKKVDRKTFSYNNLSVDNNHSNKKMVIIKRTILEELDYVISKQTNLTIHCRSIPKR